VFVDGTGSALGKVKTVELATDRPATQQHPDESMVSRPGMFCELSSVI